MSARGKTTPASTPGSFTAASGQTSRVELRAAEPVSTAVVLPEAWPLEPAELDQMIGPVPAREFTAGSPHGQTEAWASIRRIAAHTEDKVWISDVAGAITDSARTSNWRGNWEATHAVGSFAYVDGGRRDLLAGHDERCNAHSLYGQAFRLAMREQGHPAPVPRCVCPPKVGG